MSGPVHGQGTLTVPDEIGCETCTIQLTHAVSLHPTEEQALFRSIPRMSLGRGVDGYYIAGPAEGSGAIVVFDSAGGFMRGYDKFGRGPTEFSQPSMPMMIRFGQDGELYVVQLADLHHLRAHATGTVSKRLTGVLPQDALVVGDNLVLRSHVHAPDGGTPLQVISLDGESRRGIGVVRGRPIPAGSTFDSFRRLGRSDDGFSVWSAYLNRYELSLFTLDGTERLRVVRATEWFEPYDDFVNGELFFSPQRPRVEGVLQATGRLLWVLITSGKSEFEPLHADFTGAPTPIDPYTDIDRLLDTTIEVIDLSRGVLVARKRGGRHLSFVASPDSSVWLFAHTLDETSRSVVDVYSASVEGWHD